MQKNVRWLLLGLLIGLIAGIWIGKEFFAAPHLQKTETDVIVPAQPPASVPVNADKPSAGTAYHIPQQAYKVLEYIRDHDAPVKGYVGGKKFSNREKLLPDRDGQGRAIHYREWDIYPKTEGHNRGAERIVTGSDGRAWYTGDHYQSFHEIK